MEETGRRGPAGIGTAGRRVGMGAASVTGTRWTFALLAALLVAAPAAAGSFFGKKPKTEAQVKRLIDALRADPDERRRRAAVAELRDADPRVHADVVPALVAGLQKDPAPQVRADAAEAIGQFKVVFPVAGLALETAAEADPVRAVRDSALQALWEYHLIGYRSAKGADGFAGQTPEPPITRPPTPRPVVTHVSAVGPRPVAVVNSVPPAAPAGGLPTISAKPAFPPLPKMPVSIPVPKKEPDGLPTWPKPAGPPVILTAAPPPRLNVSAEPPLAAPRILPVAPAPTPVFVARQTDAADATVRVFPTTGSLADPEPLALPPVVEPPDPLPGSRAAAPSLPIRLPSDPTVPGPRVRYGYRH